MGRAKKAKKKIKKGVKEEEEQEDQHLELLEEALHVARTNRTDESKQIFLCQKIDTVCFYDPGAFSRINNWEVEVPLSVFMALKANPNNIKVRQYACMSLLAMLQTSCFDNIFNMFDGAKMLTELMGEERLNDYPTDYDAENSVPSPGPMVQESILHSLCNLPDQQKIWDLCYEKLRQAGFHKPVIKAMKANPTNAEFQHCAKAILFNMHSGSNEDDQTFQSTINDLLAAIDSSQTDPMHAYRCCEALSDIMEENRNSTPLVMKSGGPTRVLAMIQRHQKDRSIQGCGCLMLANLDFENKPILQISCFNAVVGTLEFCLGEACARQRVMHSFFNIITAQSCNSIDQKAVKVFPCLIDAMKQYNDVEVQLVGCFVLHLLTYNKNLAAYNLVTDKEATHLLANALKIPVSPLKDGRFWFTFFQTLRCIMKERDAETVMDGFLEEDCYNQIVAVMTLVRKHYHSEDIIVHLLRQMASSKRNDIKLAIAIAGGTDLILDCMKQNPDDKELQSSACEALGLITINKDPRIFEAISKADGANIILDAVDKFPKEKVIFNFGGSAAILTREYEDEQKYGKLEF